MLQVFLRETPSPADPLIPFGDTRGSPLIVAGAFPAAAIPHLSPFVGQQRVRLSIYSAARVDLAPPLASSFQFPLSVPVIGGSIARPLPRPFRRIPGLAATFEKELHFPSSIRFDFFYLPLGLERGVRGGFGFEGFPALQSRIPMNPAFHKGSPFNSISFLRFAYRYYCRRCGQNPALPPFLVRWEFLL